MPATTSSVFILPELKYDICRHYLGTFIKYYKISQLIHTQSIAS